MPELPEVESTRRALGRTLPGRTIVAVEPLVARLFRPDDDLGPDDLAGRRILGLRRRAKLLIVDLVDGLSLVLHLKLSGQLAHVAADDALLAAGGHPVPAFGSPLPHKATRAVFTLDDGSKLFFTDIRRFGFLLVIRTNRVDDFLAKLELGPEPLDRAFDLGGFRERLHRRKAPIKAALLNQSLVAGLGNIYADEALHAARVHPSRPAAGLSDDETARLHQAIREILRRAVEEGVAEIRGNKALPGREFPGVHGRAGEPCFVCGCRIERIRLSGRSTYFCSRCQRE